MRVKGLASPSDAASVDVGGATRQADTWNLFLSSSKTWPDRFMFGIKPDLIEPENTRQAMSDSREGGRLSFRGNEPIISRLRTSNYD